MKNRPLRTHAAWIRNIAVALAVTLGISVSPAASADVLGGALGSIMGREPQLTPDRLGDGGLDGLQYADPAEGVDLVAPPEPNNQGSAELSHPIWIPPGRGGVQPDLTLQYSSRAGNGWLGTGWDLSVGEIAVDTRWGVPRFETDVESETYTLDGDVLSPTAVRAEWQARVARRDDFTRRTENQFEHVVRHGDSPSNYWWEVTDKMGAKRWYGGIPDCGGPQGDDPGVEAGQEPGPGSREASAILTDADGNGYRWALSAERDIGGNLIRYFYETETNEPVGGGGGGKRLYLSRIRYTGWAGGQDACAPADDPDDPDDDYDKWLREIPKEDEAYEVRLLRDDDISPTPTARRDVIVDARGGFAESTADLLRRIEVYHGAYDETADPVTRPSRTAYDDLVRRYDLNYVEGAFGKSLLASVDQLGSDGNIYATNRFDYFDDVRQGEQYVGFSDAVPYQPGNDSLEQKLFEDVETSVLGASKTTSGDGHLYVGFNPSTPLKEGSFGGAVTIKGGSTDALAEFIDLNGDLLPDKVFHKDGQVMFRLNESGSSGRVTFSDPPRPVQNLNDLSSEFMIGVGGGIEAHAPGASIQFNVSGDVTVGRDYFIDVNDDGLADYVNDGDVKFNHLVEVNGAMIPSFSDDSTLTKVPVEGGDADLPVIQRLAELEAQLRNDSPLVDSVRRWVPPYSGTVRVTGVVSFQPPPDTRVPPPAAYDGDGVRVAIQRGDQEMWSTHLAQPGHSALINLGGSDPASMRVERGQPVYFRVQSVDNGYRDRVRWDPRIDYIAFDGVSGGVPLDVNGLNQAGFLASQDFTLAGRPGTTITMPLNGTVHFETPFTKFRQTSDDLAVVVLKNGVPVLFQPFAWHWTGTTTVAGDFPVSAPSGSSADQFEVKISISTPIDITAFEWKPRLYYTQATDSEGHEVPVTDPTTGKRTLELIVPADTDIYPNNAHQAPVFPWTDDLDGDTFRVRGTVGVFGSHQGGTATLTVKQRNELVAKSFDFTIPASSSFGSSGQTTLFNVPLVKGEQYWFDLTLHDAKCTDPTNCQTPMTSRGASSSVEILNADGSVNFGTPPHNRYTAGQQGMFPISYRGWGAAGYRAEGDRANRAMEQSDFDFRRENFPERDPEGFNDAGYKDPADANAFVFVPYWLDGTVPVWRGAKDNMVVGRDFASSSRRGADDVSSISDMAASGEGVSAVRRVGISAPTFSLAGSLGPFGGSFGAGPSFGLLDYMDMNGDSFPDIVSVDYTKYTGPRGGYLNKDDDNTPVLTQDVSFAVGGGFTGSAVDINANSKGDANTPQNVAPASGNGRHAGGQAAANGQSASADQDGFSLGGSLGVQVQFTNPNESDPGWDSALDAMPSALAPLEQELADVNGDGLPDRVKTNPEGIKVQLGTGYGFLGEVEWAGGGFETGKQFSGSVGPTLGFQISNKAFSGGLALNEAIDLADYSWVDVDGDGVLDRLRRAGDDSIMVAFGTGVGVLPEVDYGTMADGDFELAGIDIPTGEQIAQSRSRGLGAGFDFTIGIGPLCIAACYIIVNPGVHVDHSISTSQIQLMDVNGDGYPDSLLSDADDKLGVRENKRGRTNMLKTVHQAIGGEIRLDYSRSGNSEDQPYPQWDLASVEVDDHRPGDGADTLLSTFEYEGGKASRLEREVFGFSTVTEVQRAYAGDGNVFDDEVLRQYRRTYLNGTVFESGQVTSEQLLTPDGVPLLTTESTWQFVDLATNQPVDLSFSAADPAGVRFLGMAVTPQRTKVEQRWHDTAGGVGQSTWNTYEYDTRGNVVRQVDVGEPEVASDDIIAVTHYTECAFRHLDPENGDTTRDKFGDPITFGTGGPLPDGAYAYTWASVPEILDVYDADGNLLRHRDALDPNRIESFEGAEEGAGKPCDNQSMTRLDEQISDEQTATTELFYDDWGSYRYVYYPDTDQYDPDKKEFKRYKVDYVYDPDNHTHIAHTIDSHGVVSTATFDPFSGRMASRTDANGQTTSYTYDAFGRLASITGPYEQGTGHASVTFEYNPTAGYAYGIAHHFDAFHPDDTIDTVQFVDGIGRTTQRKQDASVFTGAASAASDVMVVSGAVIFDDFGREVEGWYPTTEPLGTPGTFQTGRSAVDPTVTTWDLRDRPVSVVAPGGRTTTTDYAYGGDADFGATLFTTTVTDPNGKPQVTYSDVRDAVHGFDDVPAGAPTIRTRYHIDGLGQLRGVVDNGGNTTSHTYDMLGRRTSTTTPDAGLVEYRYDPASNLVAQIDENLRAAGQQISYDYDVDRLVATDYPDGTPDVTYTYGEPGAAGNGAGRVVGIVDGAREQTIAYDPMGQLAQEVSTMLVHNLSDDTQASLTFTTSLTYDGLGRVNQLTYPDGEVLSHGYDSGGLLSSISGTKAGIDYGYVDRLEYDEFFDRKFQRTGNGVETEYGFDPDTRWLSRQVTNTPVREVQDLNYGYDPVGNVMQLHNDVPIPTSDLRGGPSTQNYHYDPYYRLESADGVYQFPPDKRRDYTFAVTYDVNGNVTSKNQTDIVTSPGASPSEQKDTTYRHRSIEYRTDNPHQIARIGRRPYTYDLNGNFTGWTDDKSGQSRTVTWDATNRVRSVADQGSTTSYTYDHAGRRAIERGPAGETAFVNQWYLVRNGAVAWKHIWAGHDRLAEQGVYDDGTYEDKRYFLHKDLQGSTNVVTDDTGLMFQHAEYFPSGEIWVDEDSDVHRTPYLYGNGYFDEIRRLIDLGERWYEPREQFLYSPDPVLEDNPSAVIGDPALLPAYTYAESNPLRLGDFDGRQAWSTRSLLAAAGVGVLQRAGSAFARLGQTSSGSGASRVLVGSWGQELANAAQLKPGSRWKRFEANPLVEINLTPTDDGLALQDVRLSGIVTPQAVLKRTAAQAAAPAPAPAAPPVAPAPAQVANAAPAAAAVPGQNAAPARSGQVRPTRPLPPIPNRAVPPAPASGN